MITKTLPKKKLILTLLQGKAQRRNGIFIFLPGKEPCKHRLIKTAK
jgi:hypothetical protein